MDIDALDVDIFNFKMESKGKYGIYKGTYYPLNGDKGDAYYEPFIKSYGGIFSLGRRLDLKDAEELLKERMPDPNRKCLVTTLKRKRVKLIM